MDRKELSIVIVAAAILASGWTVYENNFSGGTAGGDSKTNSAAIANAQSGVFLIGSQYVSIVTYDGEKFYPDSARIPEGGAIIFRNYSTKKLRVASDPHPAHDGYPAKDGCNGNAFDSCSDIPPGVSWSFNFDISGTWSYHNHLNPGQGGTVTVQ